MQQMNWGIIGPGKIAHTFAKAMTGCQQGNILAVASRSAQRAKEFATNYSIEKQYTDYAQMLADPDIQVVYIATPHNFHYQQAKMCLEAGKHVLVEKPCTVNAAQMQVLVKLAQSKNLLLQEALWSRFTACLIELKQQLDQGVIGDIQFIQSDIGFDFQSRPKVRMSEPALAGGALLDLGIYSIAISQFLLQENPTTIHAMGQMTDQQVDAHVLANLHYASGRYSQFTCSMRSQASNSLRIVGNLGYVILPAKFWDTQEALIYRDDKLIQRIQVNHPVNGFEYQIDACMQNIQQDKLYSELMSHQDSIAVLEVMDSIRQQIGLRYPASVEGL